MRVNKVDAKCGQRWQRWSPVEIMNYIFCLVSLLGAFLLFQVQPMISKFILPWFGGSPGVWTTCMLFFQMVLFGGYTYAHFLTRRKPGTQAIIHVTLLILAALLLPIVPNEALKPTDSQSPSMRILLLLLTTVGLPYFILSATSPTVQVWYGRVYPNRSPFRLYSLSNIGSLGALLSYPILIEPRWDVLNQAWIWSIGFVIFAIFMGACAIGEWKRGSNETEEKLHKEEEADAKLPGPTIWRRLTWVALPAFASVMLLATTNHVCQDVAVIPFLWVVPLALYLLTFIICFDHPRWYLRAAWALPAMIVLLLVSSGWSPNIVAEILVAFGAMFLICMVCHGELARLKPGTSHLTEYYLLMSAGGALGGLTASLIAPVVFTTFMEWSLAILIGFALVSWVAYRGLSKHVSTSVQKPLALGFGIVTAIGLYFISGWEFSFSESLVRIRNFYGTISVRERETEPKDTNGEAEKFRSLYCSGTEHGRQFLSEELKREPLTYYGYESGVGQLLLSLKNKADAKVGVIGMGTATLATYGEAGQTYRFYEINPDMVKVAENYFTYLADMKARGAKYELALGDARLMMATEPDQQYDALVLDAFSGDSVPAHLITKEAFTIYQRHMKPDGVIAVHITNHYLNLAPVVERLAREFGYLSKRICVDPQGKPGHYQPDYLLLCKNEAIIKAYTAVPPPYAHDIPDIPLWTDHAHNLFQILEHKRED
jgi:hypothetical protein